MDNIWANKAWSIMLVAALMSLSCTTNTTDRNTGLYSLQPIDTSERLDRLQASLTPEEKIAQRFIGWIPGVELDRDLSAVRTNMQNGLGGIIIYPNDFSDGDDLRALTFQLQQTAYQSGPGIGLFICADQEGGRVRTLRSDRIVQFPSAYEMATYADPQLMRSAGYILGKTLTELGINVSLSPVLDIAQFPNTAIIGDRSMGADPNRVADLGAEYIKGAKATGVASAAKHFPGHGVTEVDSHGSLPVVSQSLYELQQRDLIPFMSAVDEGVEMIMTAHVLYKNVDPDYPATLSDKIINNILRHELGFTGIVMSDGISMGAIASVYPTEEVLERCFSIGVDLILVHAQYEVAELIEMALAMYKTGVITDEMLDTSLTRILSLKIAMGLTSDAAYDWR